MGLFRRATPAPRIQTLAEMIAYALTSEVTRAGWVTDDGRTIANDLLGIVIHPSYRGSESVTVCGRRAKEIPFDYWDQAKIGKALEKWHRWREEQERAAALLNFVDDFEKVAAQAGEAFGRDGETRLDAKHEHAVPNGDAPK